MNDYLWDRTGRDEEVERLEELMAPMALQADRAPVVPAAPPARTVSFRWMIPALAAIALFGVLSIVLREPVRPLPARTIKFEGIGRVEVEADSIVRVLERRDDLIRLRLERGTIRASIGASVKPRLFQVETPSTTCVDLGCHYTLSVDEEGRSVVRVETGRVAFVDGVREVYVPSGASCRASRVRGSGTPVFDDAGAAFRAAVHLYDDAPRAGRVEAARRVVSGARQDDWVTLWHLAVDAERAVSEAGVDALIRLIGAPTGVTREATLAREDEAMEKWKLKLGMW